MKILAIGSHPDDVEHAMGGTISKLKNDHEFLYLCFSKCLDIPRNKNIMEEYEEAVSKLSNVKCEIYDFPNRKLPECGFDIRENLRGFENLRRYDMSAEEYIPMDSMCPLEAEIFGQESKILRNSTSKNDYLSKFFLQVRFKQKHGFKL